MISSQRPCPGHQILRREGSAKSPAILPAAVHAGNDLVELGDAPTATHAPFLGFFRVARCLLGRGRRAPCGAQPLPQLIRT